MEYVPVNLFGDEDLAQEFAAEAMAMHRDGVRGRISFGKSGAVSADILDHAIHIHADFMPEYILIVPMTATDVGLGYYRNYVIGYSHRRDTMLPYGLDNMYSLAGYTVTSQYDDPQYISDGYASQAMCQYPNGATIGRPTVMGITLSISALRDELFDNLPSEAGPIQGVLLGGLGYTCLVSPLPGQWELPPFTSTPYGVVRGGNVIVSTCAGTTRQTNATVYEYDHVRLGVDFMMGYSLVEGICLMARSSQSTGVAGYVFQINNDIMFEWDRRESNQQYYYEDGSLISAWPVVTIPIGNNSILIVARNFVADASRFFGGKFELRCWSVRGNSPLIYSASAVGAVEAYLLAADGYYACYSTAAEPHVYNTNDNVYRMCFFLNELSLGARCAIPLGNGTTLVVARVAPQDYEGAPPQEQLVCVACTESGITHRGTLKTYYGWGVSMGGYQYRAGTTCMKHTLIGATFLGGGCVAVFYRRDYVYPAETYIGIFRFMSDDGGVTWSESQCSFDQAGQFMFTAPKLVTAGTGGSAKLIAGLLPIEDRSATTYAFDSVRACLSDDGGLTWTNSPMGSVGLEFELSKPVVPSNHITGLGTVMRYGNYDDGYAPSPYTHLPNFYGTPSKGSRDSSADPNL